jgi:hypothetical protein
MAPKDDPEPFGAQTSNQERGLESIGNPRTRLDGNPSKSAFRAVYQWVCRLPERQVHLNGIFPRNPRANRANRVKDSPGGANPRPRPMEEDWDTRRDVIPRRGSNRRGDFRRLAPERKSRSSSGGGPRPGCMFAWMLDSTRLRRRLNRGKMSWNAPACDAPVASWGLAASETSDSRSAAARSAPERCRGKISTAAASGFCPRRRLYLRP